MATFEELRNAVPHPTHPKIGHKMWKVPVRIQINDSRYCETVRDTTVVVISGGPVEAANWVRDKLSHIPETEITAYGPRGGETHRYIGWHSAIGDCLVGNQKTDEQMQEDEETIFGE